MFAKATFWMILAALTLPIGLSALAEDPRPDLGGPPQMDDDDRPQRRRGGFDGEQRRQRPERGERGQRGGGMRQLMEELDLTDDQQGKVREILQSHMEQARANREKNKTEIEKIDAQIKELMEKRRSLMGGGPDEMLGSIRNVLNADQQTKLDQHIAEMKQRGMQGPPEGREGRGNFRRAPGSRDDGDRPQRPQRRGGAPGNGGGNDSDGSMLDL